MISRLHDKIDEQHARIAELEAQLEAIGAGGVEPLRKQAAAQQAVQPYAVLVFERCEEGPFDRKPVKPGSVQHLHAKRDPHYDYIELYTHPTTQGLDKVTLLSKDHTGMKVDYRGLLGQVQREIKRSAPGHAEMIRQLQEHMQELGQRWYAGQTEVVDELLQLYCIESGARKALAAQAKQGGAA